MKSLADQIKNSKGVALPFNLWVFNRITPSSSADGISLVVMVTDLLAGEHVSVSTSRSYSAGVMIKRMEGKDETSKQTLKT